MSRFAFHPEPNDPGSRWECDGCGKVVSGDKANGVHKGCKSHMGWMEVGGRAHTDYHEKGVHPMESVREQVRQVYAKRMAN